MTDSARARGAKAATSAITATSRMEGDFNEIRGFENFKAGPWAEVMGQLMKMRKRKPRFSCSCALIQLRAGSCRLRQPTLRTEVPTVYCGWGEIPPSIFAATAPPGFS